MAEEIVYVPLNMEETGILCHVMMANDQFRNVVLGRGMLSQSEHASFKRWLALYEKLGIANDKLMGKDI